MNLLPNPPKRVAVVVAAGVGTGAVTGVASGAVSTVLEEWAQWVSLF